MVPFVALVGYLIFKKSINNLILIAAVMAVWLFSGSNYVQEAFQGDTLQVGKVLPIIGFGVVIIGVVVYALFMRSD